MAVGRGLQFIFKMSDTMQEFLFLLLAFLLTPNHLIHLLHVVVYQGLQLLDYVQLRDLVRLVG